MTPRPPAPQTVVSPIAAPALTDLAAVLRSYHRQQLVMHLIGPTCSLVLHVVGLTFIGAMAVSAPPPEAVAHPITLIDTVIRELEPPALDLIASLPEPTVDRQTVELPQLPHTEPPTFGGGGESASGEGDGGGETAALGGGDGPPTADVGVGEFAGMPDVRLRASPIQLPFAMRGRAGPDRVRLVRDGGGHRGGQDAVGRALRYLATKQHANGAWGAVTLDAQGQETPGADSPAHTGLALLCFLAHGETVMPDEYGETVLHGLQWLSSEMLAKRNLGQRAYGHGIATYALAEAFSMSRLPLLRQAMETGIETIIKGQQPGGGFDYDYAKGARWDLSVSGWQFQALKAAQVAGATSPGLPEAITKAIRFCKQDAYRAGRFGYSTPGSGGNMTGVGTVALQLLGAGECREVREALATIAGERLAAYEAVRKAPKSWDETAAACLYGWYYDTQAMFNQSGKHWRAWRSQFEPVLMATQQSDGSWGAGKPGAYTADRILGTTWCCLQLEVYYRYLPTTDINKMNQARPSPGLDAAAGDTQLIID